MKHNLNDEEKIAEIKNTFSLAPLYIMRIKALRNRMTKIEENLAGIKGNV